MLSITTEFRLTPKGTGCLMKNILFIVLSITLQCCFGSSALGQTFVASHNKSKVDSLANSEDATAQLLTINGDSVLVNGTSASWSYCYRGSQYYYFHTTLATAIFDSASSILPIGITTISMPWYDSDSALALAEGQGGTNFRTTNAHYTITASLGEPLVPNSTPRWYINYRSTDNASNSLLINLDAADSTLSGIGRDSQILPTDFHLNQNYPNPFNPSTTIQYGLPTRSRVKLQIFNILGQVVADLVNTEQAAGWNRVMWNANVASGLYFYRLDAVSLSDRNNRFIDVKKMTLLK